MSNFTIASWKNRQALISMNIEEDNWPRRWALALGHGLATHVDLSYADLTGAVLTDIDLPGIWLLGADLTGSTFDSVTLCDATLADAILKDTVLEDVDLSNANLRGADLHHAALQNVNCTRADLTSADLTQALLSDVNFTHAALIDASLQGTTFPLTVFTGALLTGVDLLFAPDLPGVPRIPDLDRKILAALEDGGRLEMDTWHSCKTTHCRAGWAIHLAGTEGEKLERRYDPALAAALLYTASSPNLPIPDFFATKEDALEDMRARAEAGPH